MAKQPQTTAEQPLIPSGEPEPNTAKPDRLGTTTAPKPRHDVSLAWLSLIGLLILGTLPLRIDLTTPAVWSEREALSVAISSETRQRKAPIADVETSFDAWTLVYQGESRWDLPPGETWLHLVFYSGVPQSDLNTNQPNDAQWVKRARLGSMIMALLFVAAVFWAAYSIGGLPAGAISALVAMTMPLLLGFGRHANPYMVATAWSALSIAGALWAMRPLRTTPSLIRQLIGWVVCGIGLGLATLSIGPTAIPGTLLCTIVLAMCCPRRIGHIMGLLASTAIAALMLMPWAMHVHSHDPDVWQQWLNQIRPDLFDTDLTDALRRAGWRLSMSAAFSGLWLIWLIPALIQPFSTSTGPARRKLLLGWGWLVTALLLVAFAPGQTNYAGLLIGVAPASVAIALIIQHFHSLSAEGRHARLWLISRWLTCGSMLSMAIVLPLLAYLLNHRPEWGHWLPECQRSLLATMHWSFYAGAAAALLLASALAIRFAMHNHPGRTTASLALWLLILLGLAAIPASRSERLNTPHAPPTERIRSARL